MSIWKNEFAEPEEDFPDKLVQDMIDPFETHTQGLASLHITKKGVPAFGSSKFSFQLILGSSIVKGYSFEVFSFSYPVELYPVDITFADDITDGLKKYEQYLREPGFSSTKFRLPSQEVFKSAIIDSLNSDNFLKIVGGLIKTSKRLGTLDPKEEF